MNWRNLAVVTGLAVLLYGSFRALGWWGFSLVSSGIVFWLLQLTTRLMQTMERAAEQPLGSVANAVMFHAQLHDGLRLLKVIGLAASAMTFSKRKPSCSCAWNITALATVPTG